MSQSVRSLVFLGVAVVCVGVGFATHSMYKPVDLNDFSDVGSEFYPDFSDPGSATGLRVASFNEDSGKTDVFSVDVKDGVWRIPSHHEYPADAKDQLAKTAASMVGVDRQALIERTKAAHKRYNLLDPLDDKVTGSEGRGDRITLYKGDELLVDFIVGKQVEGQQNVYHVRAAGEDRFYTANLGDFKISTKFSDWIEKDILDISPKAVSELIINRYRIDETKGVLVQGDRSILNRKTSTDDWTLEDLKSETEELETSNIDALLTALDDLAIVGVRKKPSGISADLKAEEGISITQRDMLDLRDKGFFIDPRQGRILSNEGEVLVGTNDGVLYALRFGEEFSGSDVDIEVGGNTAKPTGDDADKESDDKEAKNEDQDAGETVDEENDSLAKSRFLFVTAQFDDALLGEKPTPPVKPEPPAKPGPAAKTEKKEDAKKEDPKAEEAADSEEKDTEKKEVDKTEADKKDETADTEKLAAPGDEAKPDPQKEYEEALKLYEEELEVYEIKLKDYEQSIEKGQERVAELNLRFADWYYVISADVFDRMKLNRVDLVKEKEEPADDGPKPGINPGDQNAIIEALMKKQAAEKAAADAKKPAENTPAEKKSTEKTDAAKKDGTKETVDPKKPEAKPATPPEVKKPESKAPADPPKSEPKSAEKETPKAEATPDQPKAKEEPPVKSE